MIKRQHLLITALLSSCAIGPEKNFELDNARSAYTAASNDSQVVQYAPAALDKARENLLRAEHLFDEEEKPDQVAHHIYLSRQYLAIARETALLKLAEQAMKHANTERENLILLERTQQAQASAKQAQVDREAAQAKAREAELARQQTENQLRAAEAARLDAQTKAREFEARGQQQAKEQAQEQAKAQDKVKEQAKAQDKVKEQAKAQGKVKEQSRGAAGKKGSPTLIADLKAQETKRGLVVTLGDVLFEGGEAELKPEAGPTLDKLGAFLKEQPKRTVLIEGFTDNVGSEEYNQYLSERRAKAVRQQLLARGIATNRITVKGYGKARPIATNDTAAGREQNRRVEVVISNDAGDSGAPAS